MSDHNLSHFELDPEELGGFTVEQLRCSACSGYGNCGFRSYRILDGKPVLLCNGKKQKLMEAEQRQGKQM